MSTNGERDVAILGVGMHPWGKWGRNFVEYGIAAAHDALDDAGLAWTRRPVRVGCRHHPQRLPRLHRRARPSPRPSAGPGVRVVVELRRLRVGRHALARPGRRSWPASCDVALVVGADTTPKGFFAPVGGDRQNDPDWLRFRLLGATNPIYFALYARRRMDALRRHRRGLRPGEGEERRARPRQPQRPLPQGGDRRGGPGRPDRRRPAAPARDLRHVRRRRGDRRVRASSTPAARRDRRACHVAGRLDRHAALPEHRHRDARLRHRLGAVGARRPTGRSRTRSRAPPTRRPGIGPDDLDARRGLRPVHRPRARLVREHRPVRAGRGRGAAERRATPTSAAASRSTRAAAWPASARPSPPRPSPRSASSPGSCGARPTAARSRAPRSASPSTRACSATARPSSSATRRQTRREPSWPRPTSSTPSAPRSAGGAAASARSTRPTSAPTRSRRSSSAPASTPPPSRTSSSAASTRIGPQAGDIARTCWLAAGLPEHVPGTTIDRQCGSSQQAVHFAAQARDERHAGPGRRRRRAEHEPDPDLVGDDAWPSSSASPTRSRRSAGWVDALRRPGGQPVPRRRDDRREVGHLPRGHGGVRGRVARSGRCEASAEGRFEPRSSPLGGLHRRRGPARAQPREDPVAAARSSRAAGSPPPSPARSPTPSAAMLIASRAGGEGPRPHAAGPHPPPVACAATTRSSCSPRRSRPPRTRSRRPGMTLDDIDLVEINEAFASVVLAWQQGDRRRPGQGQRQRRRHRPRPPARRHRRPPHDHAAQRARAHRRPLRPPDHVRGRRPGQRHHHRAPVDPSPGASLPSLASHATLITRRGGRR